LSDALAPSLFAKRISVTSSSSTFNIKDE
jgi:hypothetical protein